MNRRGLGIRMRSEARRISGQHDQLDSLFASVQLAITNNRVHTAHLAFERFADALEAHLSLEEGFHFPALRGLCPRLEADLIALVDEHGEIRSETALVLRLLGGGESELSAERLESLVQQLMDHEKREEQLLAEALSRRERGEGFDEFAEDES